MRSSRTLFFGEMRWSLVPSSSQLEVAIWFGQVMGVLNEKKAELKAVQDCDAGEI